MGARTRNVCSLSLWLALSAFSLALFAPTRACAQAGPRALPALLTTPRMNLPARTAFTLSAAAGYGIGEALSQNDAVHQALLGSLASAVGTPWGLAAELRLDGRGHQSAVHGQEERGLVGALRGYLRYSLALGPALALGAEIGVWVPGRHAPSLRLDATTLDALLALDARLGGPLSLALAGGFRFDRSARVMPDAHTLSAGDWVALGLSDAHAALARVGIELALSKVRPFVEWTWDALVGTHAPGLRASPMHLGAGTRVALDAREALQLAFMGRALLSRRPELDVDGPLRPFPSRAELWVTISYTLRGREGVPESAEKPSLRETPAPESPPSLPEPPSTPEASADPPAPEEELASGQLRLLVRDHRSGAALSARVKVRPTGQADDVPVEAHQVGNDGRLELTLTPGRYTVEIRLKGYRRQRKSVEIEDQSVTMLDVALHARSKKR